MKLDIKVKVLGEESSLPKIIEKGDWVDLKAARHTGLLGPRAGVLKKRTFADTEVRLRDVEFSYSVIPLGIAMKLPKGFEAVLLPRSSTFKKFGVIQTNSMGVIDNSYCGNDDEWGLPVVALKSSSIEVGDRVCQFRIQLSQSATIWQKIKWFFCSGIKFTEVDNLDSENRGGFGSTGVK